MSWNSQTKDALNWTFFEFYDVYGWTRKENLQVFYCLRWKSRRDGVLAASQASVKGLQTKWVSGLHRLGGPPWPQRTTGGQTTRRIKALDLPFLRRIFSSTWRLWEVPFSSGLGTTSWPRVPSSRLGSWNTDVWHDALRMALTGISKQGGGPGEAVAKEGGKTPPSLKMSHQPAPQLGMLWGGGRTLPTLWHTLFWRAGLRRESLWFDTGSFYREGRFSYLWTFQKPGGMPEEEHFT